MSKRYLKLAFVVVPIVAAAALMVASIPTQAGGPSAPTDVFTCTPAGVAAFTNRVHVRCSPAAPNSISYFAYCSSDSATASRFLSVFTTAKATGKQLDIFYTPGDLSGTNCGCNQNDCRVLWGAEVRP
ncbi:MAG: hypothetical protein HGB05_09740 [Chloroflexi bacterium]|nr:hypothetical protein [Chloroflexota bacterium]